MGFTESQRQEVKGLITNELDKKLPDLVRKQFEEMKAQGNATLATVDPEAIPIVDDLNYFTAGEQYLAPKGLCPENHAKCFLFRYRDKDGTLCLMHVEVLSQSTAQLFETEKDAYRRLLEKHGMTPRILDAAIEAQMGGQGGLIWQQISKQILEVQFKRQSPQHNPPSAAQDGTQGISGHNVEWADGPSEGEFAGQGAGGVVEGTTEVKVQGGETGGG